MAGCGCGSKVGICPCKCNHHRNEYERFHYRGLAMRLSDAGFGRYPTNFFYPDNKPAPQLIEAATRDHQPIVRQSMR